MGRAPIDDASGLDAAEEMDCVMDQVRLPPVGLAPPGHQCDPHGGAATAARSPSNEPAAPKSVGSGAECRLVQVDQNRMAIMDPLDTVISNIHRAGLQIQACCEKSGPAFINDLDQVTHTLDVAVRQLQVMALNRHDASTLPQCTTSLPAYWAWSEQRGEWVGMTFYENQAWLARPDLDPVVFTSHKAMA